MHMPRDVKVSEVDTADLCVIGSPFLDDSVIEQVHAARTRVYLVDGKASTWGFVVMRGGTQAS